MAPDRYGSAVIELPNDLDVLIRREFEAPIEYVFDAFTKSEQLRKTCAPFDEVVTVCSIDLRVGGDYHFVFVTPDGTECSFRGTYLEIEPPIRTVQTWRFDGWPDVEAVESMDLQERDGVTKMTYRLSFRDQAGRDHMHTFEGHIANFDKVEDHLRSILNSKRNVPG